MTINSASKYSFFLGLGFSAYSCV